MRASNFYISLAAAALALIGAGCLKQAAPPPPPPSPNAADTISPVVTTTPETKTTEAPPPATKTTAPATKTTAPAPIKTTAPKTTTSEPAPDQYVKALNTYRNAGAYLQFINCRLAKPTLSIKKGLKFMLDNPDPKAHTVALGKAASYRMGAYGYVIATAPAPGRYAITCDGINTGLLNVEG